MVGPLRRGRRILVFVDGVRRRASREALAFVRQFAWPGGATPEVVDLSKSREAADWYGIKRGPAVAVVDDGMLIAIEHACTPEACQRLVRSARRGQSLQEI